MTPSLAREENPTRESSTKGQEAPSSLPGLWHAQQSKLDVCLRVLRNRARGTSNVKNPSNGFEYAKPSLVMDLAASVPSLWTTTLEYPPSCIAFCPGHPELVVVGTYFLHPAVENQSRQDEELGDEASDEQDNGDASANRERGEQKRSGSLILFRVEGDEITQIQILPIPTSAILDIQWSPHAHSFGPLLAVATSTGHIAFYRLHPRGQIDAELVLSSTHAIADPSILVLSLAWHPHDPNVIGGTLSTGAVVLCRSDAPSHHDPWRPEAVIECEELHSHELEAWTLAFLPSSPGHSVRVLSGGDDCVLRVAGGWSDRKIHSAGVTAILPLGETGELIVTGSYDDRLRLVECPAVGRRQVLTEMDLGGGVWRLSELRRSGSLRRREGDWDGSLTLLASCMHAGARVVRLRKHDETWEFEVLVRFEEHASMNYGSVAQPSAGTLKTIVSTSFYDKKMCLWRVDVGV